MRTTFLLTLIALSIYTTSAYAAVFTDNGDLTVTDATTGLMWQQCTPEHIGVGCVGGGSVAYTWEQAITYCEGLSLGGFDDWRLPNIKELSSIVDTTKSSRAIQLTYFPDTMQDRYWSSSTDAGSTTDAWIVHFLLGVVGSNNKSDNYYVRCVR